MCYMLYNRYTTEYRIFTERSFMGRLVIAQNDWRFYMDESKMIKTIVMITERGSNAEVRREKDGSYTVFEITRKKKTVK